MGKFVSGFPTKASLKQWSTYGQLGTEAEKPTCQNTGNPSNVRFSRPGGRDGTLNADAGMVSRSAGHKFPDIKAGGCSGEGRIRLSAAQRGRR